MEKLKSSMKTFHESLTSSRSPISPICLQEQSLRTLSFRESSSSSSTSSPKCEIDNIAIPSERFFFSPHKTKNIMEESSSSSKSSSRNKSGPSIGSTMMALESYDPYGDFRRSMEEMVAVHGIREWTQLQELLNCYLELNEEKTHRVIVVAFVDLLMHLVSRDDQGLYDSLPLALCLDLL